MKSKLDCLTKGQAKRKRIWSFRTFEGEKIRSVKLDKLDRYPKKIFARCIFRKLNPL